MSHKRKREDNRRLKKTHDNYGLVYFDKKKNRYIRVCLRGSQIKKYYKRYSNKRIRQRKDIAPQGNMYRRVFDYWWELD